MCITGVCFLITLPFRNERFQEIFAKYWHRFIFELCNGYEMKAVNAYTSYPPEYKNIEKAMKKARREANYYAKM